MTDPGTRNQPLGAGLSTVSPSTDSEKESPMRCGMVTGDAKLREYGRGRPGRSSSQRPGRGRQCSADLLATSQQRDQGRPAHPISNLLDIHAALVRDRTTNNGGRSREFTSP